MNDESITIPIEEIVQPDVESEVGSLQILWRDPVKRCQTARVSP